MKDMISIKGTREGLTITLGAGEMPKLMTDIAGHLTTQGAFFRGGRVALEVGDRAVSEQDLTVLTDLLAKHDMILRTIVTTNSATEQAAKTLGLRLIAPTVTAPSAEEQSPIQVPKPSSPPVTRGMDGSKGMLIRHMVRSGQVIRHTGHIVIVGDVNAGAEIVAGGDIVVWGKLSGTAHAGAMSDASAVICALQMSPMLLRIGEVMARAEEVERKSYYPEIAYVRDHIIVVQPWDKEV